MSVSFAIITKYSLHLISVIQLLQTSAELAWYQKFLRTHLYATLWQSLEWKAYQEALGKEVRIYAMCDSSERICASAMVVIDKTIGGLAAGEVTRGPLWNEEKHGEELVHKIVEDAKKERCMELLVSPIQPLPANAQSLFVPSKRHVQPTATRIIDLSLSEEELLKQMHPKGRYNIGIAQKNNVKIRVGDADDIDALYDIFKKTAARDDFTVFPACHYKTFLKSLQGSFVLLAEQENTLIAGLIGVTWHTQSFYYYGASSYEHRQYMAPYALQWEAMKKCKQAGCTTYDLLGVSDERNKMEDARCKMEKEDPWHGITEFKRKFGGSITEYPPEQTLVLRPFMKKLIKWKRKMVG